MIFEAVTIKDVKEEIGALIKMTWKKRGINRDELAAELSLSRITISNLEQGKNTTLDTLLKINTQVVFKKKQCSWHYKNAMC